MQLFSLGSEKVLGRVLARKPVAFTVVRHPYERLVSAFKDKVQGGRVEGVEKSISFNDFLRREVLSTAKSCAREDNCRGGMHLHWTPYNDLCSFCNVNYTVISKMETFQVTP